MIILKGLNKYLQKIQIFQIRDAEIVNGIATSDAPTYLGTTEGIIIRLTNSPFRNTEFGIDTSYSFIGYFDINKLNVESLTILEGYYIVDETNNKYLIVATQILDNILVLALQDKKDFAQKMWGNE